ncbi:hypothetical protein [Amycolatopsis sp. cmx-4-61]|uniref:hypothetical protein n=1 Tax=Amycolatopsis sp. cmx-4-61 TaxID=2790937 RepID=UPI00397AD724
MTERKIHRGDGPPRPNTLPSHGTPSAHPPRRAALPSHRTHPADPPHRAPRRRSTALPDHFPSSHHFRG